MRMRMRMSYLLPLTIIFFVGCTHGEKSPDSRNPAEVKGTGTVGSVNVSGVELSTDPTGPDENAAINLMIEELNDKDSVVGRIFQSEHKKFASQSANAGLNCNFGHIPVVRMGTSDTSANGSKSTEVYMVFAVSTCKNSKQTKWRQHTSAGMRVVVFTQDGVRPQAEAQKILYVNDLSLFNFSALQ